MIQAEQVAGFTLEIMAYIRLELVAVFIGIRNVVLPGRRVAVFVHGCFWHAHRGCRYAKTPASRREFWEAKLAGNIERDARATEALLSAGWRVLVVWECATRSVETMGALPELLRRWINGSELSGEFCSDSKRP